MPPWILFVVIKKMVKERKRSKAIADKSAMFLNQNAKPSEVDEDWLNVFLIKPD